MIAPPPAQRTSHVADATVLLEAEHTAGRELLAMLLRMPGSGKSKARVLAVVVEDLWIHMQLEDELFYPALRAEDPEASAEPAGRAAAREVLARLERCSTTAPDLEPVVRRMLELLEDETSHQEEYVFPRARRALGHEALAALGDRLRVRRQELRESGAVRRGPPGDRVLDRSGT